MSVTRRRTIAGFATIPLLALAPATLATAATAAARITPFRSLSARLTGFDVDRIHADRARGIVEALLAEGHGPALDRLLAGQEQEGDPGLAAHIVEAWYVGTHPGAGWSASRLFREALVWQALDFAQPPGLCTPASGGWHQPPSDAAA